jgi:aspartyl-tRNA(Asn)/glutamyl-tRNA(Gln) amidotransferase subunit A
VPQYESTVTTNLWKAGAVMVGKTNLDEFAMGSSNMTSHFGGVENPWKRSGDNRKLVPGRLVRRLGGGGRGLHGAGQHRHRHRRLDPPAGVVLRHRRAEADLRPLLALGRGGLRQLARPARPFARTVEDSAILLQAMSGHDPKDSTSAPLPVPDFAAPRAIPTSRACGSAFPRSIASTARRPRSWRCGTQGIEMLKAAGAVPVEISLPHTKYALPAYYIVAPAECSSNLARYDGVRFGLARARQGPGRDVPEHARRGLRQGSAPPHHDRHLRAVGRLLRRLLQEGAADPLADRPRLQAGLREVRRAADADRADRGLSPPARRWTIR